jgi:hypothetical protein
MFHIDIYDMSMIYFHVEFRKFVSFVITIILEELWNLIGRHNIVLALLPQNYKNTERSECKFQVAIFARYHIYIINVMKL